MFTVDYWLHHYEYAMGHKPKLDEDTSNVNWTRHNLTKILNGDMPYGMTGTNGAWTHYIYSLKGKKMKNTILELLVMSSFVYAELPR